uniref:SANT domain-containing protein n=1 Tax=Kalanchoe fedtschenkoi TaxID=63787 RepID=A0A7N0T812_KALFE
MDFDDLDPFDDFLEVRTDANGEAAKKFKPKSKPRPKPRSAAHTSVASQPQKEKLLVSVPSLPQESSSDATHMGVASAAKSVGLSDSLNNVEEQHSGISLVQQVPVSPEPVSPLPRHDDGCSKDAFHEEQAETRVDGSQTSLVEVCPSKGLGQVAKDYITSMDSEFDSFDDFLAAPTDSNGAATKFKPKAKGRPKPRSSVVLSTSPHVSIENALISTAAAVETVQENAAEVAYLSPPRASNSICVSDHLNKAESASLKCNQFDDIDPEQSISTARDGGEFRPKLKSRPVKQTLSSAKSGLTGTMNENHVEISSDAFDSNRQENLGGTDVSGNNNIPEGSLQDRVPLDDSRRFEMENSSSINVVLDDLQFDVTTIESFHPQSRSSPDKSLNSSRDVFMGDRIIESYQFDNGEIPCSIIMVDQGNPHSFVDQESNTCDSSQAQSMFGVTGNQNEMSIRDSTTSMITKPSDIDSGRMEPEHRESFDNGSLDDPSISGFPLADDYFSINEPFTCGSEIGQSGASLPDNGMHVEATHEIPVERVDDSAAPEGTGTRQPSRVLRKRKARSTRPAESVDCETDSIHGELHSEFDRNQDEDYNEGNTNQKKKGVQRSRKSVPESDQPNRSRKKVKDASSEQQEKPKKKFSHSTRGRRKRVDPTLLATPDDEIDHRSCSFRDLILRAEFLERDSKKVSTPSSVPATNQRTESPSPWDQPYNERSNFDSDQHGEYDYYEDDNIEVQESSSYFNYHSYMTKTPRASWSKLDTELFYQGIRQFGTDFTVIQQLFPGRTRHQIKLKYKKEERQHPQRVSEAIENRAKGISYFQQVIEQLKATDTQADQELGEDPNEVEDYADDVLEENAEPNENGSTRLELGDVVAKDDVEALDTAEVSEKMDEDDDYGLGSYVGL